VKLLHPPRYPAAHPRVAHLLLVERLALEVFFHPAVLKGAENVRTEAVDGRKCMQDVQLKLALFRF
jgi:hypothetical protein